MIFDTHPHDTNHHYYYYYTLMSRIPASRNTLAACTTVFVFNHVSRVNGLRLKIVKQYPLTEVMINGTLNWFAKVELKVSIEAFFYWCYWKHTLSEANKVLNRPFPHRNHGATTNDQTKPLVHVSCRQFGLVSLPVFRLCIIHRFSCQCFRCLRRGARPR